MSKRSAFHLSLGVKSIDKSANFFVQVLEAEITHRDQSGYINIDLFGNQITLKQNISIKPNLADFHFGINLSLSEFDRLSKKILEISPEHITMNPEVWDKGTSLERKKMYLKCPTGYLIELKGYS